MFHFSIKTFTKLLFITIFIMANNAGYSKGTKDKLKKDRTKKGKFLLTP